MTQATGEDVTNAYLESAAVEEGDGGDKAATSAVPETGILAEPFLAAGAEKAAADVQGAGEDDLEARTKASGM